jgi:hypothetical protein
MKTSILQNMSLVAYHSPEQSFFCVLGLGRFRGLCFRLNDRGTRPIYKWEYLKNYEECRPPTLHNGCQRGALCKPLFDQLFWFPSDHFFSLWPFWRPLAPMGVLWHEKNISQDFRGPTRLPFGRGHIPHVSEHFLMVYRIFSHLLGCGTAICRNLLCIGCKSETFEWTETTRYPKIHEECRPLTLQNGLDILILESYKIWVQ